MFEEGTTNIPETEGVAVRPFEVTDEGLKYGEEVLPFSDAERVFKDYRNDTGWRAKNTQEAQRLSEERKSLEKARQLETYLNEHPELYGKVEEMFKGASQPVPTGQPDAGMAMREIESLKRDLALRDDMTKVKSEMETLKTKHADMFSADPELEGKVIRHAIDNDIRSIRAAFADLKFDEIRKGGVEQGLRKAAEGREVSRKLAGVTGGTAPHGKSMDPSKYSTNEWYEMNKEKFSSLGDE